MSWNKKITSEDEREIISLYQQGFSGSEILYKFSGKFKTTKTIYDCLKRFGIDRKEKWQYSKHDHFYFNEINNANKAYVLGLMIADGWISPEKNLVAIQLQEKDIEIIKRIKKEWKTDNKIISCQKKPFKNKDGTKIYNPSMMNRIAVNSPKMIEDLYSLGIFARKSKNITLPCIGQDYDSHMFRGIIDGDGSIYNHSNGKNEGIRINGSHYLVAQACLYLYQRLGISYRRPSLNGNISFVDYTSESDILGLSLFLYKDIEDSFCIKRKKDVIKDYLI
jgi:hypothetical protein